MSQPAFEQFISPSGWCEENKKTDTDQSTPCHRAVLMDPSLCGPEGRTREREYRSPTREDYRFSLSARTSSVAVVFCQMHIKSRQLTTFPYVFSELMANHVSSYREERLLRGVIFGEASSSLGSRSVRLSSPCLYVRAGSEYRATIWMRTRTHLDCRAASEAASTPVACIVFSRFSLWCFIRPRGHAPKTYLCHGPSEPQCGREEPRGDVIGNAGSHVRDAFFGVPAWPQCPCRVLRCFGAACTLSNAQRLNSRQVKAGVSVRHLNHFSGRGVPISQAEPTASAIGRGPGTVPSRRLR
jgi:hypothetical protein